jgi:ketosteroid isomerase-like protein
MGAPARGQEQLARRDTYRVPERKAIRVVRESIEAFNRGEFDRIAAATDPDFELLRAGEAPDGETLSGPEAMRRYFEPDAFRSTTFEIEKIVDGGAAIIVEGTSHAIGAGSGAAVEARIFLVYTLAGERLKRMQIFFDRKEAERAAGLTDG